jgi:uncharacterized protein (DUF952 family)
MSVMFHITTPEAWQQAQATGAYTADSLASEGFIHCSDPHQVAWVANTRFRGRADLLVLHVREEAVDAAVRRENLEGGAWLFPHVYGPIAVGAVVAVTPLSPAADGSFDHLIAPGGSLCVQSAVDSPRQRD